MIDELVKLLKKNNMTIATMESCTGGYLAHLITNIEGASDVLKFSAITYSNEYKIKMGVDESVIDNYSVYSAETACEMSKQIALFTGANIGVGITGKLNKVDKNNLSGVDNVVFISIYDKDSDSYYNYRVTANLSSRLENKREVTDFTIEKIVKILKSC